jgi:plastocyanin
MRRALTSLSVLLLSLPLTAASLDVRVTAADGANVSDAVVYAIPSTPVPVGHKVAQMDQKNRAFVPHVLAVQTGTWVEFPNSDNIRHQVYSISPVKKFQLPLYTGKPSYPVQFTKAGVVEIGCNIHEQMSAQIVVVDTPYFGKTEAGAVTLSNLPAGQYNVRVWYAGMKDEPKAQSIKLNTDDRSSLSFVAGKGD